VCKVEAEDLITSDIDDSHSRNLKKVDALLTDIRQRLGEPEPDAKPLDPEMKTTLDQLEKTWNAQRPSQAKNPAQKPQGRLDHLIEEQDRLARAKQDPVRTERPKERQRDHER
jgi:hypothetical protein